MTSAASHRDVRSKRMLPRLPDIGDVLCGKYRLVSLVGEGGIAVVYEARHERLGQRVALKVLAPEIARDPALVRRFEREARANAALRTRHVVRVSDVDVTPGGLPFMVMEYLEGRDLDHELNARGSLPLSEVADYVLQTCAAMLDAHAQGMIHRDLKPANMFLADDGAERIIKVLDFGISKFVGESTRSVGAGGVLGTAMYMSPEQVAGSKSLDTRSDIWALGVILFELVTGRPPWRGTDERLVAEEITSVDAPDVRAFVDVPPSFANLVHRMLRRDVAERVQHVREVALALRPFAAEDSVGASIAEQVLLGTGPRIRLAGVARPADAQEEKETASEAAAPTAPRPEVFTLDRRVMATLYAVLLTLGAVGAVLILVSLSRRADSPPTTSHARAGAGPTWAAPVEAGAPRASP